MSKTYFALVLAEDAGFKQLSDRLLFGERGSTLVFESESDAETYRDTNPGYNTTVIIPIRMSFASESES